MNHKSLSIVSFIILLVAACTVEAGPQPSPDTIPYPVITSTTTFTQIMTSAPTLTSTPELTPTLTITPAPTSLLACTIFDEEGKLYVLSTDVFFSWGPKDEEITQALAADFPEWADFEQTIEGGTQPSTIGYLIEVASLWQETFALNPAVTLVTLGVSLDWQLPPDGDLYSRAIATGERLHSLWFEWTNPENGHIRARHPELANDGATYALYTFFNQDIEKLQVWCDTYQQLFGDSPLHR